jgi:hypothetical protein
VFVYFTIAEIFRPHRASPRSPTLPIHTLFKGAITYSHDHTSNAHIRTEPFTHSCGPPDGRDIVLLLVAIDDAREYVMRVGRCTDCQEDDEEEGLEVEEGGL